VLVGLQLNADNRRSFREFMDQLGYRYWEETDNPAFRLFAGSGPIIGLQELMQEEN
jgi:threonine dehydratase